MKTKTRLLKTNTKFFGEDGWFKDLIVGLDNYSGKTVTFVGLEIVFWRTEDQPEGIPATWPLKRGIDPFSLEASRSTESTEILAAPGANLEILLSEKEYSQIRAFLKDGGFPESVKKIELQVAKVGFSDGSAWNGRMYRRDLKSTGPLKGWTPTEDDSGATHPSLSLPGSAKNGTAIFVRTQHTVEPRQLTIGLASLRKSNRVQNPPCGEVAIVGVGCEGLPGNCFYERADMIPNGFADALQPSLKPCITHVNGQDFPCGPSAISTIRIQCPNPPSECAQEFYSCVQHSDCCSGLKCGGGQCIDDEECFPPCTGEYVCFNGVCGYTPVVVDVLGNGFDLTNAANGVIFDANADGVPGRLSWTSIESDDAWLVFDRNGNGAIDDGSELFGSSTPQPNPASGQFKNGFLALATFDRMDNGGNSNGRVDIHDAIFSSLRLWQDSNHNGISETTEMKSLASLDVVAIDLEYSESRRIDQHGNQFRYRAKIYDRRGASVGRWAWDVFLVQEP